MSNTESKTQYTLFGISLKFLARFLYMTTIISVFVILEEAFVLDAIVLKQYLLALGFDRKHILNIDLGVDYVTLVLLELFRGLLSNSYGALFILQTIITVFFLGLQLFVFGLYFNIHKTTAACFDWNQFCNWSVSRLKTESLLQYDAFSYKFLTIWICYLALHKLVDMLMFVLCRKEQILKIALVPEIQQTAKAKGIHLEDSTIKSNIVVLNKAYSRLLVPLSYLCIIYVLPFYFSYPYYWFSTSKAYVLSSFILRLVLLVLLFFYSFYIDYSLKLYALEFKTVSFKYLQSLIYCLGFIFGGPLVIIRFIKCYWFATPDKKADILLNFKAHMVKLCLLICLQFHNIHIPVFQLIYEEKIAGGLSKKIGADKLTLLFNLSWAKLQYYNMFRSSVVAFLFLFTILVLESLYKKYCNKKKQAMFIYYATGVYLTILSLFATVVSSLDHVTIHAAKSFLSVLNLGFRMGYYRQCIKGATDDQYNDIIGMLSLVTSVLGATLKSIIWHYHLPPYHIFYVLTAYWVITSLLLVLLVWDLREHHGAKIKKVGVGPTYA